MEKDALQKTSYKGRTNMIWLLGVTTKEKSFIFQFYVMVIFIWFS